MSSRSSSTTSREARVAAFAKLNLDLRVLYQRPDRYHELRSVFQTISLADSLGIRYRESGGTEIRLAGNVEITDNIIVRAARMCLDEMKVSAAVDFELDKRIPMGAGLGGGSSDAAAVLLALPRLAGKRIPEDRLHAIAAELGSDVPFFLIGGTAAVWGRGEELYPLADLRERNVLVVSPDIHVSTPEAYSRLSTRLQPSKLAPPPVNDFESVVFEQHPRLKTIRNRLRKAGASTAMMTGSGSSIFGIFPSAATLRAAASRFPREKVFQVRFVTRAEYRQ
jgi:4-diphosphocytidyl-2-C-methyl-D-erythritol kinase